MASPCQEVLACQGFTSQQVMQIFHKADVDNDGKVAGQEAMKFFAETGVDKQLLARIWNIATDGAAGGLTPPQFSSALRLVSLLQTDVPFNNEFIGKALHPITGMHLPRPVIGEQYLPDPEPVAEPPTPVQPTPAAPPLTAPPRITTEAPPEASTSREASMSGLLSPQTRDASSDSVHTSTAPQSPNFDGYQRESASPKTKTRTMSTLYAPSWIGDDAASKDAHKAAPFRIEVRTFPANSKQASKFSMLHAANGVLFAGPTNTGGMAFYVNADTKIAESQAQDVQPVEYEDADNVQPVLPPDALASGHGKVTCMHWDRFCGCLYTGHAEGKVVTWDVGTGPEATVRAVHEFSAHRTAVSALLMTPWGTLWTGSSQGSVRLWADAASWPRLRGRKSYASKELRQPNNQRAHLVKVDALYLSANGQVVYAKARSSINCWDACSGTFLGKLSCLTRETSSDPQEYGIDRNRGLDAHPDSGRALRNVVNLDLPPIGSLVMDEGVANMDAKAVNMDRLMKGAATGGQVLKRGMRSAMTFGSSLVNKKVTTMGSSMPVSNSAPSELQHDWDVSLDAHDSGSPTLASSADGQLTCMCCTPINHVWLASKYGRLESYTALGKFVGAKNTGHGGIKVMCAVGMQVWTGLTDGYIIVWDANTMRKDLSMLAHDCSVIAITQVGNIVYSLGSDGSIHGWNGLLMHSAPDPEGYDVQMTANKLLIDANAHWQRNLHKSINLETLSAMVFTWNVNEGRPSKASIEDLLAPLRQRQDSGEPVDLVIVGLQEVEMGTASVAMGAVKERIKTLAEQGNKNAQWWETELANALVPIDERMQAMDVLGDYGWKRIGLRQLSGMLLLVFAHSSLTSHGFALADNVMTNSIACGVGGFGGNKGAVAISIPIYRHRLVVINSHFAAHQKAVDKRNADYATIVKGLTFSSSNTSIVASLVPSSLRASEQDAVGMQVSVSSADDTMDIDHGQGIRSAHALIWMGDFNYRIDLNRDVVEMHIQTGRLDELYRYDQASTEMEKGYVFQGMREGIISFNPTYKFDKGSRDLLAYDTSEKRRIPAWTDRIFFRGSTAFRNLIKSSAMQKPSPTEAGYARQSPDQVIVKCEEYKSIPNVFESDHKPVYALLSIEMPVINIVQKRKHVHQIMRNLHDRLGPYLAPSMEIDTTQLSLTVGGSSKSFTLSNSGLGDCHFFIRGASTSAHGENATAGTHLPWLCFNPVASVVPPSGQTTVTVTSGPNAGDAIDHADGSSVTVKVFVHMQGICIEGVPLSNVDVAELSIRVTYT